MHMHIAVNGRYGVTLMNPAATTCARRRPRPVPARERDGTRDSAGALRQWHTTNAERAMTNVYHTCTHTVPPARLSF